MERRLKADPSLVYRNIAKKIRLNSVQESTTVNIIKEWFKERVCFKNVIFTDEARFSLDGPDKFISWQLKNNMGDFNRVKRPDASLIVTRLHGTIDSKKYIALLEDHILPYIESQCFNKTTQDLMSAK